MPRAPQSMALLAGRPRAKRQRVLQQQALLPLHALQQGDVHGRDAADGGEAGQRGGVPDEGVRPGRRIGARRAAGAMRSSASAMR